MRITNVTDYLKETAARYPDKAAFVGEKSSLTFRELKERADELGGFLISKAIYKEPVLVFMDKSPEEAAAFLGIISGGSYHIALDRDMAAERIRHILNIASARLMICDRNLLERVKEIGFEGEVVCYEDISFEVSPERLEEVRSRSIDTDPLYVVFTSGSTGIPKGVIANHRNVIDYIEELSKVLECSENTIFGNQAPFYLDACLKDFYTSLKYGATTYIIPKKLFRAPVKLIEYLNEHKINTICFVVSALTMLTKLDAFDFARPEHLKVIAFGGEVFPPKHLKEWIKACPQAKFINLYGPTECTGMSSYYVVDKERELEEALPIGSPFPNTDIFLLDEEDKRSNRGEICIRGTGLTAGYYRDRERTAESFVQNPLNQAYAETIYRTGDLGAYNDRGELCFIGRKDNQIKHMGYRIELDEIELVGNACNKLTRGVCFYDKASETICFVYEGEVETGELKKYFREKLPAYMVPTLVERMEKLPIGSGGKIDRLVIKSRVCG